MVDPTRSDTTRSVGELSAPDGADNVGLMEHLAEVQSRARQIMREFHIGSAHICVMARSAEQTISDTALRAEFLRLLIDLHEFGREAKHRGLLGRTAGSPGGPSAPGETPKTPDETTKDTRLFAPNEGASDEVSDDVSRDFFAFLDR